MCTKYCFSHHVYISYIGFIEMLQIASWNINGFSIDKINEVLLAKNFDIFGIVESWTSRESNISLPGYIHISSQAVKSRGKRGRRSGGLIVYYKKELSKMITKINNSNNFIWLKLNKSQTGLDEDIYLGTVYLKPRTSSVSPEHDNIIENLRNSIHDFSQKGKIILMGDFNARTAELNDFVTLDNVSYQNCHEYLPTDYTTDIQLPQRQNMDFIINEQGKCLIDLCIESKIRILNGRVMGDSLGSYTYYSSQGKSCIDYVISSENIVHMFNFINVLPPNELSDHCII